MSKLMEAKTILKALGLPPAQYNEMACLTLLALAGVKRMMLEGGAKKSDKCQQGCNDFRPRSLREGFAENTRETFRRQVLHQFVQAHVAEYNPYAADLATTAREPITRFTRYVAGPARVW